MPEEKQLQHINSSFNDGNARMEMSPLCPCCLNGFSYLDILERCKCLIDEIAERGLLDRKFTITCDMSDGFDALRVPVRAIMTRSKEKKGAFPNFFDVFPQVMKYHMLKMERNLAFVSPDEAEVHIEMIGHLGLTEGDSIAMCKYLCPDYQHKVKRVRLGQMRTDDRFEVGRVAVDKVLRHLKSLSIEEMRNSLKSYREHLKSKHQISSSDCKGDIFHAKSHIKWNNSVTVKPLYILGRYRKFARDVPQAPWDVRSKKREHTGDDNDEDDFKGDNNIGQDQSDNDFVESLYPEGVNVVEKERLGRNSVEEIVSEAVCKVLNAKSCRMHPCGREDIDVRMLGNGRPFAMEVIEASISPTQELLDDAVKFVDAGTGMNSQHDIELLFLELGRPSLFASMQPAAESKDKGYRCVIYSEKTLSRQMLIELEQAASPKLQLLQKTPLRVLHRRPLLDRTRFVYQLKTELINEHYFILSLNTSAGTYVKEFVHGDLGRTVPSVSSILDTHANILQLDVTWLYDEYRGGGQGPKECKESLKCSGLKNIKSREGASAGMGLTEFMLDDLKLIPLRRKGEILCGIKRKNTD